MQVVPADPGGNAWAPNPNPFTIIGDPSWTDYSVTATATFTSSFPGPAIPMTAAVGRTSSVFHSVRRSAMAAGKTEGGSDRNASPGLTGTGNKAAMSTLLGPCDPTGASPGQRWAFDDPVPGYLSTQMGGYDQQCLNVNGCGTEVITWTCVTSGGTCCGSDCYANLQWNLTDSGELVSLLDQQCVTNNATAGLVMAPCGQSNQTWVYNASSLQLQLSGTGLCLGFSSPVPYVQVCGRITTYNGFNAAANQDGYCLRVDLHGKWSVTNQVGGAALAVGALAQFSSAAPHTLHISFADASIAASIDNTSVALLSDSTYATGNVGLGSGWHVASFNNFEIGLPSQTVKN